MASADDSRQPLLSQPDEEEDISNTLPQQRFPREDEDRGTNFLSKFSVLEKLLFLAAVVLFILTCVFGGLYAAQRGKHVGQPGHGGGAPGKNGTVPGVGEAVCMTPQCVKTAAKILTDMDMDVNPCDDFYGYTCGDWERNHMIPNDKPGVGSFDSIFDDNLKVLKEIMESDFKSIDAEALPSKDKIIDEQNFRKLKDYYVACLNETAIDAAGAEPVKPVLERIHDLFPGDLWVKPSFSVKEFSRGIAYLQSIGVAPFFDLWVTADDKNPDVNALYLGQSGLGLPSKEYYEEPDYVEVYTSVVEEMLQLVLGESDGSFAATAVAKRIVDFETTLARFSNTTEELYDPEKTYNPHSITQLTELAPSVDWSYVIDSLTPKNVRKPNRVIVQWPPYMAKLSDLVSQTEVNTLKYYMMWQVLHQTGDSLGEVYRKPLLRLKAKVSGVDPKVTSPRWQVCVKDVDRAIGQLAGRYYVLAKFPGESKDRAFDFISSIKEAFVSRLPSLEWMDEETRKVANQKVETLIQKVGYSEGSPDVQSPISLAEYYQSLAVTPDEYFKNSLSAKSFEVRKQWEEVGAKVNKAEWHMTPQTVNAYYNPPVNEIVFPAGIMQSPFFDLNDPEYLNYGGIGVVVGHELTHGFDNTGRQYDPYGKLTQWWTDETVAKFESLAQCFIDEYSNFTISNPSGGVEHVNGKLTLGENLADNGGLREAYTAWKKRFDSDSEREPSNRRYNNAILPGLEHLSRDQLYYINFGRVWCSRIRPENALARIRTDPHSPPRWRVNGAVVNSEHFAKVFNCPADSKMNPPKKCELW
ncbi:hypothetical protein BZG36_02056 [Bifiguratus adelaidae]|uniref:Endothelin-converting enzyme 1 n=1 Tax=Bifiguratus adelaidae TaxID=1938954 RepID=A0A261Y1W9_9FUNG|nr:hypothetical protein BZG36_02056 [Bifiguratus adelaidae]